MGIKTVNSERIRPSYPYVGRIESNNKYIEVLFIGNKEGYVLDTNGTDRARIGQLEGAWDESCFTAVERKVTFDTN